MLKPILAIAIAIFAFAAAFCWFKAGTDKVMPEEAAKLRANHFKEKGISGYAAWTFLDGSDMEFTFQRQSDWNRRGAIAAGLAAICQAAYVILTEF